MTPRQRQLLASGTRIGAHAVQFTNSGNVINVANNAALQGLTQVTLEAWVYLTSLAVQQIPVRYRTANAGYMLQIETSGVCTLSVGNGTSTVFITTTSTVPINTPTHIAVVWNGTHVDGYVGGVKNAGSALAAATTGNPAIPLAIGNFNTNGTNGVSGLIQEIRVSNNTRYSANFIPPGSPFAVDAATVALWHMSEGSGTSIFDVGPNRLVGAFAGKPFPAWVKGMF